MGFVRIYTNIYNPYIGVPSAILGGDTITARGVERFGEQRQILTENLTNTR